MLRTQVETRPLGIEGLSSAGTDDDVVEELTAGVETDLRYFLLSVTGSEFLAHGEMVLR